MEEVVRAMKPRYFLAVELGAHDHALPQAAEDGRGRVDHGDPADLAAPQDRAGLRRADDLPPAARGPQGGEQQLDRPPAEVRDLLGPPDGRQRRDRAAMVAATRPRAGPGLHDPQAGPSRQPQRHRRALAGRWSGPSWPWPAWAGTTSTATPIPRRSACCDASRIPLLAHRPARHDHDRERRPDLERGPARTGPPRPPDPGRHRPGRDRPPRRCRGKHDAPIPRQVIGIV